MWVEKRERQRTSEKERERERERERDEMPHKRGLVMFNFPCRHLCRPLGV